MLKVIYPSFSRTGALLETALSNHPDLEQQPGTGDVYYGISGVYRGFPSLNQRPDVNKLRELMVLQGAGLSTVPFLSLNEVREGPVPLPLFGRNFSHRGGKDIIPILDRSDLSLRLQSCDYFTTPLEIHQEVRSWIFRGKHLGTLLKCLDHPEKYRKIGRNHQNGWSFRLMKSFEIPRDAVRLAQAGVDALGLDFGAVDLLQNKSNMEWYILEVNTAPGISDSQRQVFRGLARHIITWHNAGMPGRADDNNRNTAG